MQFDFTDQEIAIIGNALGSAPFREAAPIIASIQRQLQKMQANKTKEAGAAQNGAPEPKPRAPSRKKAT